MFLKICINHNFSPFTRFFQLAQKNYYLITLTMLKLKGLIYAIQKNYRSLLATINGIPYPYTIYGRVTTLNPIPYNPK